MSFRSCDAIVARQQGFRLQVNVTATKPSTWIFDAVEIGGVLVKNNAVLRYSETCQIARKTISSADQRRACHSYGDEEDRDK